MKVWEQFKQFIGKTAEEGSRPPKKKYNGVFEEQLNLNILEKVPEEIETSKTSNNCVHYTPHQAVITPQKITTKRVPVTKRCFV